MTGEARTRLVTLAASLVTLMATTALNRAVASPEVADDVVTYMVGSLIVAVVWGASKLGERHEEVMARLSGMEASQRQVNLALASVMRSDLITKAQRHIWELRWATPEEKLSWHAEWQQYHDLGADGYIDSMAEMVLSLPERPPKDEGGRDPSPG